MSRSTNVVLACDGLNAQGCPHASSFTAEMRNYRRAREEASLLEGWRVCLVFEEGAKNRYIDVCRKCMRG